MSDPRSPVEDFRATSAALRRLSDRLDLLEAPSGTQAFRAVSKLQDAVEAIQAQQAAIIATQAELATVVDGLEERLDSYLETEAPAIIDARVATQVAAILAGNVTIGGALVVNGALTAPAVYGTDLSVDGPYRVVWVNEAGKIGHT